MGIHIIGEADSIVQLPFISSDKHPLYKKHGYHTGIDLTASDVHSYASGVVISIGRSEDIYAVTVQYDSRISLRYLHLKSVCVYIGDILYPNMKIGTADQYVHFEYVSVSKDNSIWPVRIGTMTYYKQDPELVLNGSVKIK